MNDKYLIGITSLYWGGREKERPTIVKGLTLVAITISLVFGTCLLGCKKEPRQSIDSDLDGLLDENDHFPFDTDNDGTPNSEDDDDDNDGVKDEEDDFPFNPLESKDTDGDGIGNNADTDDDNDGLVDGADAFPEDPSEVSDSDNDGTGDRTDNDDDNDGFKDEDDLLPKDLLRAGDHDNDGRDSLEDDDDDGDCYSDTVEMTDGSDPLNFNSKPADPDNDCLSSRQESELGTNPNMSDSDSDGLSDGQEVGLSTNPLLEDTDGDGRNDASEVGSSVSSPLDFDGDGLINALDFYEQFSFRTLEGNSQTNSNRLGIATDSSGNHYISDPFGHRVLVHNRDGILTATIGMNGSANGEFDQPNDVAVGNQIYVADTENDRIQVFDLERNFVRSFGSLGTDAGLFVSPRGIDIGLDGRVFVADTRNHRIQRFNSDGTNPFVIGGEGSGTGQFSFPNDVAVDSGGKIFVADRKNYRIQVLNSDGTFSFEVTATNLGLSGPFALEPASIDVDSKGQIYVLNSVDSKIYVLNSGGTLLRSFGASGEDEEEFLFPMAIHLGERDKLFVSDRFRIQEF